jgi:hypothetical protein
MQAFQERVIQEQKELEEKLDKLTDFLQTDTFLNLEEKDRELLLAQHTHMVAYNTTLALRIKRFK